MPHISSILVHVNANEPCQAVVDCAVELAKLHRAKLTIVDMVPDSPWPVRFMTSGIEHAIESLSDAKQGDLNALADRMADRGTTATAQVLEAPASVAMIHEVLRHGYGMVIKVAKGPWSRREGFFGTSATRLLRKCPCPVLLVQPDRPWKLERIVAAVDTTTDHAVDRQLNAAILQTAHAFCVETKRQLDVVCTWSTLAEGPLRERLPEEEFAELKRQVKSDAANRLDELLATVQIDVGRDHLHLIHADAIHAIPAFVQEQHADLLVMGTIGRSGLSGLLIGNTAEQILNRVKCSVLAVKPETFVSPIRLDLAVNQGNLRDFVGSDDQS